MTTSLRLILMTAGSLITPALCAYYYRECKELIPGALLCWFGGLLNYFAVIFNGLQMPVFTEWYIPKGVIWKVADAGTRLPWLCDRFVWGNCTYSVGDVAIFAGAGLFFAGLVYRFGKKLWEWAQKREQEDVAVPEKKIDELFKRWEQ